MYPYLFTSDDRAIIRYVTSLGQSGKNPDSSKSFEPDRELWIIFRLSHARGILAN